MKIYVQKYYIENKHGIFSHYSYSTYSNRIHDKIDCNFEDDSGEIVIEVSEALLKGYIDKYINEKDNPSIEWVKDRLGEELWRQNIKDGLYKRLLQECGLK